MQLKQESKRCLDAGPLQEGCVRGVTPTLEMDFIGKTCLFMDRSLCFVNHSLSVYAVKFIATPNRCFIYHAVGNIRSVLKSIDRCIRNHTLSLDTVTIRLPDF